MLRSGTLIHPLPEDGSIKPLSDVKVQAEILYNRIPFSKLLFMFNLTVGMLAFFYLLYCSMHRSAGKAWSVFTVALYAAFLFQLFGYCLRWYVGGRIPLSNGYETMQFMALCTLLLACIFRCRFSFTLSFGLLISGFALLVAYLGQNNPQITPLMPVLLSPWLSIHVSLIMVSYALFAFMMLNGLLAFCIGGWRKKAIDSEIQEQRKVRVEQLMLFSRLMLYPAVFCLGAGILLVLCGQMFHGGVIGPGTRRSLGFDLLFNLWCGIPRTIACRLPATPVLPCLYGVGFPYGADDLLRSKLSAGRYA